MEHTVNNKLKKINRLINLTLSNNTHVCVCVSEREREKERSCFFSADFIGEGPFWHDKYLSPRSINNLKLIFIPKTCFSSHIKGELLMTAE